MGKICIIADDLTGATDSGVQLIKKGFQPSVIFNLEGLSESLGKKALVVDTDSRSVAPEEAYARVKKVAENMLASGFSHVYKKIDSTLRGNIGVELLAIEEVFRPDLIVIAPAFPKMGRLTRNGHHYVHGKLITESDFAKDPKTPVTESFIPRLINEQAQRKVKVLNSSISSQSIATFTEWVQSGERWIVCDVENDSDFEKVVEHLFETGLNIIWVGSAGLMEYLPVTASPEPLIKAKKQDTFDAEKVLIVSGSQATMTKRQLLEAMEIPNTMTIQVNLQDVIDDKFDRLSLAKQLQEHASVTQFILHIAPDHDTRKETNEKISDKIVENLAKIAHFICEQVPSINGLILTGGDTAKAVCSKLQCNEMELLHEVETGIPFGKLCGYRQEMWVVTKAGGFGNKHSLINAVHYLQKKV